MYIYANVPISREQNSIQSPCSAISIKMFLTDTFRFYKNFGCFISREMQPYNSKNVIIETSADIVLSSG